MPAAKKVEEKKRGPNKKAQNEEEQQSTPPAEEKVAEKPVRKRRTKKEMAEDAARLQKEQEKLQKSVDNEDDTEDANNDDDNKQVAPAQKMVNIPLLGQVPASDVIFIYETPQAQTFKHLIDSLRETTAETPFFITPQGIEISRMSPQHGKLLVQAQLFEEKINEIGQFHCSRPDCVRVDLSLVNLMRIIRSTSGSGDSITMYQLPRQEHTSVTICLKTADTGEITVTELATTNIKVRPFPIPNKTFPVAFDMNSARLQQLARDLQTIGARQVEMTCSKSCVIWSANGEFTKSWSRTFCPTDKGITFTACDGIVQGNFSTDALQSLVKCCSLSKRVSIYAMNDFPIVVEFGIGLEGRLRCCLGRIQPNASTHA